ncbi:MAG: TniQ family protein [Desulfuromonadales bacterium]|nr:TniQ family protein [Desulfuromonadales bacterium]
MSLSGRLWPIHLKPQPDELLSSWLVRLARAHHIRLHSFCDIAWPKKQIWNRDIDKSVDSEILETLSSRTATPIKRVRETTLWKYEGWLYEKHNPLGNTHLILPIGVFHRTHKRFGLQFCPLCLAEDLDPFFRCRWRLSIVTVCEKHKIILWDRCPECEEPIAFHRASLDDSSITFCWRCRFDLRNALAQTHTTAKTQALNQIKLLRICRKGWVDVPNYGPVYSVQYFAVYRQILQVLSRRRAANGREHLMRVLTLPDFDETKAAKRVDAEYLPIGERYILVAMANWVLLDWPNKWISFCCDTGLWTSQVFRDIDAIPFWYWEPCHEWLNRSSYHSSDQEVMEAGDYLERLGRVLNEREISRMLGVRQVFRKRWMG